MALLINDEINATHLYYMHVVFVFIGKSIKKGGGGGGGGGKRLSVSIFPLW